MWGGGAGRYRERELRGERGMKETKEREREREIAEQDKTETNISLRSFQKTSERNCQPIKVGTQRRKQMIELTSPSELMTTIIHHGEQSQ